MPIANGEREREGPADDAATPPHESDASVVEVPGVDLGCLAKQHESLSIGHYL